MDISSAGSSFGSARGEVAKSLVILGLAITVIGLVMMAGFPLGRLPGDFHVRRGAFSFYFPLTSSLLVSALLTLVLYLLRR